MDALLINPFPGGKGLNEATVIPPVGLGYIAAVLEKEGFKCSIIDANLLRLDNEEIIARIPKSTRLIGIYLNSFTYEAVKNLTPLIRKNFKDCAVVLGGPLPTAAPDMVLAEIDCSGIVRGEGEYAVLGIMRNIKKGLFPFEGEITGAAFYEADSKRIVKNPITRIKDLDGLPFPAYHLFPKLKFYRQFRKSPSAPIITSRGCAYNCIFCCKDVFEKKITFRSSQDVLGEIDYLVKQYGIRQLDIIDDHFACDQKRMHDIFDGIIRKKYNLAINMQSGIRTELLDEPLLDKMKKAGVYKLAFGIESADKEVLTACHKQINLDKVKDVVRLGKKKGFLVYGFFIIGLPGETEEAFERTLNYAKALKLDVANFCMAVPFVGTELYRMVKENGRFLIDTTRNIQSGFYDGKVFYEYKDSKEADVLKRYKRAYREFYSIDKKLGLLLKARSFNEIKWFFDIAVMVVKGMLNFSFNTMKTQRLKMLALREYVGVNKDDPIRFYGLPFIGSIYRKRVERCLSELSGGTRVIEIGFGSGVTFLNLNEMYREIHGLDLTSDAGLVNAKFKTLGIQTFLKSGNVLKLPYPDGYFDSVLLISILEHLKPEELVPAFREIFRVLRQGGQVVYGVPVDRMIMNGFFRLLGYNIKKYHFSSQEQVATAAGAVLKEAAVSNICVWPFGKLYEIGHFIKHEVTQEPRSPERGEPA